jgi:rhamnosyl/mannosyltransferase
MRVLHAYKIFAPDSEGGVVQVISDLTMPPRDGLQSSILAARPRGAAHSNEVGGVPVHASGSLGTVMSMPISPAYLTSFARQARHVDLVVHHAPFPLTDLAIVAALPRRVALIVHWHADIVGRALLRRLLTPLMHAVLRRADRIVVADAALAASSPFLQPYRDKCSVCCFGTDVAYWSSLSAAEQAEVEALRRQDPRLVLGIGRLVSYKGFEFLIRALQYVDATAIIVGEGPLEGDLRALAETLGVAERVRFAGRQPRDRLKMLLHAARMIAMPSISAAEAFGLVQIEAMAAGRPVINTWLPTAVPHIARDGQEGLTVPPGAVEDLSVAIARLLDEPGLAQRLGDGGAMRAREMFQLARFQADSHRVYREVVRLHRASS